MPGSCEVIRDGWSGNTFEADGVVEKESMQGGYQGTQPLAHHEDSRIGLGRKALDPLRDRDDFKKLMAELEAARKPADAKPPPKP